jgi:preprotein translocase SecF subunit
MILYITVRFEFGFALGALAGLVHDVLVVLGLFLLCGRQISLLTVAAILTIVGYSINDTIVIFDRIREELRNPKSKNLPLKELCNKCLNGMLSRTLLTSLTTAITVVALLVFSKGDIRDFAVVMLFGVVIGTFSSIFVATPVMIAWHKGKRPDLAVKK